MSTALFKLADNRSQESWAHRFRARRFQLLKSMLATLSGPIRLLDVGGTAHYWNMMGDLPDVQITLLNLEEPDSDGGRFETLAGDATNLPFADQEFDVIYSNSVIEHLFDWDAQVKMASEISRVSKHYFVQTPNYYFPIEPHWVFPGFHYLPKSARIGLTQRFQLGHMDRLPKYEDAKQMVEEVKLLSIRQMRRLFPDGSIWRESIGPLTKSIVSYRF